MSRVILNIFNNIFRKYCILHVSVDGEGFAIVFLLVNQTLYALLYSIPYRSQVFCRSFIQIALCLFWQSPKPKAKGDLLHLLLPYIFDLKNLPRMALSDKRIYSVSGACRFGLWPLKGDNLLSSTSIAPFKTRFGHNSQISFKVFENVNVFRKILLGILFSPPKTSNSAPTKQAFFNALISSQKL